MRRKPVEYFADVGTDRTVDNPYFVWRRVRKPFDSTQRFDPETRQWIDVPWLVCYTHWGEIGSVEITEQEAARIIG